MLLPGNVAFGDVLLTHDQCLQQITIFVPASMKNIMLFTQIQINKLIFSVGL